LGAAARLNSIIAAGKSAVCRPARSSTVQLAAAGQHHRKQRPWLRPHRKTPRRQLPRRFDHTQLQTMARGLAGVGKHPQLRANQQQMANVVKSHWGAQGEQEEIKRVLARVSGRTRQDVTASTEADSDRASPADVSVSVRERGLNLRSGSTRNGSRRWIIEVLSTL
jgi:hypothetical protein